MLYKDGRTQTNALERIDADHGTIPEVAEFLDFIRGSQTGINTALAREGARAIRAS